MAERRGLVIGARIASGAVATGVAGLAIAAIALLPLPLHAADPRTVTVEPAAAAQLRVCPGATVRLGDATGENAAEAFAIDAATIDGAAVDGDLERARLRSADASAPPSAAPEVLRVPPTQGALVGGAQLQNVDATDFRGLAATTCGEPSGSSWLVGGATTVGRSTFLLLSNPTEVASRVSLDLYSENGSVSAPGLSGIDVPPGEQRVLSLAGFAPGMTSPVVRVTARGGRIVASLQQSIVRGLDAVGVDAITPGADPATSVVVPGVRIVDAVGALRASARVDWQDLEPIVRIAAPGDVDGEVTVRVVPSGTDGIGTSFAFDVAAGRVTDMPLSAGLAEGAQSPDSADGSGPALGDGVYTVYVEADIPVVAAVRVSTAVDTGDVADVNASTPAPPSDLAWFAAAPPLGDAALLAVPDGPAPVLAVANPSADDVELTVEPVGGGDPILLVVPAGDAVTTAIEAGSYRLSGAESLSIGVSFADPGLLAAFVLAPDRPVAGPVVVRTD